MYFVENAKFSYTLDNPFEILFEWPQMQLQMSKQQIFCNLQLFSFLKDC